MDLFTCLVKLLSCLLQQLWPTSFIQSHRGKQIILSGSGEPGCGPEPADFDPYAHHKQLLKCLQVYIWKI